MTSIKEKWIETQSKTYVKWVNAHLPTGSTIATLPDDVRDGVALTTLICTLFTLPEPRGLVRDARRLESRILRLQNVHLALKLLDQVGIHTHLAADAVVDGKLVLVLGLVWRLIVAAQLRPALTRKNAKEKTQATKMLKKNQPARRSGPLLGVAAINSNDTNANGGGDSHNHGVSGSATIGDVSSFVSTLFEPPTVDHLVLGARLDAHDSEYGICDDSQERAAAAGHVESADLATRSARDALLHWCAVTADLAVTNFAADWADARPYVALVEALAPGQWRWQTRDSLAEAFRAAQELLGIAPLLDVADLIDPLAIDERSVMTYVSEFVIKHRERKQPPLPSTLFREQSTTSTRDGDDDDVNDVGTADEKQRRERLQYPDDSDDDDGAEIEVRSPHPRAQVATDEYEAQVRSHHRAYAERTAARAANSPLEAGYGVSGGVSPAPNTPPTNRLVNPKYLVSPEEADAAGYGVTPAVAPNQPDADAVEYFDPTKHYVDYNDDDDDNNVPESPRKQKGGNSRLVSVQPDVPLDSGTLRAADIKAGKPSSRNTGIQRRPVVGSLRQHGSTSSMSSAIAATPTPTSSGSSSRSARAVASTSSESTTNVTIAAVTGHKMQPHVTTMQYKGDDLVHVERYRDGKLVTGGEVVKKKDKKAAAAMPTVTVSVRNASSSSSKSASAMVPLEGSNSTPLRSCKCPNCFQKNKYQPGTERLMCYSCRTTFRVPK